MDLDKILLNLTSSSKSIKGLDLREIHEKKKINPPPKRLLTFIFNEQTNQMLNSIKFKQNFLTISMDVQTFQNLTNLKTIWGEIVQLSIHSPQSPFFIANIANKLTQDSYGIYDLNSSLIVHKTVKLNLGHPYGVCSHYKSHNNPFKSISQSDCLRKCSKTYFEKILKCSPLLTNGFISELDETETETKFCSKELNDLYHKTIYNEEIRDKCNKLCPKDCAFIDFKVTKSMIDGTKIQNPFNSYGPMPKIPISTTRLLWDMTSPIIYYIETPVMSFVEYLCCCGGLFALWFASDGKLFLKFIPLN